MAFDAAALQRFSLKIFAEPASAGEPSTIIPVFHTWIQEHAVPGLLIDVADYTHLVDGPSVLLAAHEANYALDETGGRPGLSYTRKQPLEGTFGERLAVAAAALITAARRLEQDTARMTGGGIDVPGQRDRVRVQRPPGRAAECRHGERPGTGTGRARQPALRRRRRGGPAAR